MKTKFNFYNVLNNDYPLYELCEKNGWINKDSNEEFDALSFFEGDPDIIKIDGETGYFYKSGKDIYYWFDCWGTSESVEAVLTAFFNAFETGVSIGGESWMSGKAPRFVEQINGKDDKYIWDIWEETQTGIAFRGGAGYFYRLFDFGKWLEKYEKRKQQKPKDKNFKCHGFLCVCNWGGYEIEIDNTGESARLADNFGDVAKVRRWQSIKSNSRGEYVTRYGRKLYLSDFSRV